MKLKGREKENSSKKMSEMKGLKSFSLKAFDNTNDN